jgi:hypothetical protein
MKNLDKKLGLNSGQFTMVNLFAILITLFLYTIIYAPLLGEPIADLVTYLTAHPTTISPALIVLAELVPFVVLLSIVITALNYAIPQREAYR